MRKITQTILILTVAALAATGCRSACPPRAADINGATQQWTQQTEGLLRQAADQLGVQLTTQPMVHYAQWGASFYAAPAANLDRVTAEDFEKGVDLGVIYVDSPGQTFPKDYYRLNAATAPNLPPNKNALLRLYNRDRRIVATLPAMLQPVQTATTPEFPADISISAASVNNVPNRIHTTALTTRQWEFSTQALVVPPPLQTAAN